MTSDRSHTLSSEEAFWATTVFDWIQHHLPKSKNGRIALAVVSTALMLALVAAMGLVPLLLDVDDDKLAALGYAGIFIVCLAATSWIVLPLPGMAALAQALIIQQDALLNPVAVGLIAGVGMALGEAGMYVAGAVGSEASRKGGFQAPKRPRPLIKWIGRTVNWLMANYGVLTLIVLSVIPNPIIDVAAPWPAPPACRSGNSSAPCSSASVAAACCSRFSAPTSFGRIAEAAGRP